MIMPQKVVHDLNTMLPSPFQATPLLCLLLLLYPALFFATAVCSCVFYFSLSLKYPPIPTYTSTTVVSYRIVFTTQSVITSTEAPTLRLRRGFSHTITTELALFESIHP